MESCMQSFIPIELAHRFYKRWDCEIQMKEKENIYYKCLEGKGEIQFHNGNIYVGQICDGILNGKGTFKWLNGLVYEGQFKLNSITGKGKYTWPDNSKYQGYLVDGKRHGYGVYYSSKDNATYSGMWQNGMKHGKGIIHYQKSAYYDGQFKMGKRQGWGKMHYKTGNQYQGEWVDDCKSGKGTMNWHNVNERYVGNWTNDQPNGIGEYYWFDCKVQYKTIKSIYKGQWVNGKRQGYGAFYYSNGCKYEGYFKDNAKEGFGVLIDQLGYVKVDYFHHDKSSTILCKQISLPIQKSFLKLPEITKGKKDNKVNPSNNLEKSRLINNSDIIDNPYEKFIDFQQPSITSHVTNLLLRNNSQLRSWYKLFGVGSISTKDYYGGMTLQNFWRLVKDAKLNNDFITLAKLDRQFEKGNRSKFQIELPKLHNIQMAEKYKSILNSNNYGEIDLLHLCQQIQKSTLNWNQWKMNMEIKHTVSKDKNKLHNGKKIILFRHFICLLLHISLLFIKQTKQQPDEHSLKNNIELLIKTIHNIIEQTHAEKVQSTDNITFFSAASVKVNTAEWAIKYNRDLLQVVNMHYKQLYNTEDQTISVRTLYSILQKNGYLKDAIEKMLFLEKVERQMNTKITFFRKDMKQNYQLMEKIVLSSPHYAHIMNYEMIARQFDELIYQAISRKMTGLSQQDLQTKYAEAIQNLINYVKSLGQKENFDKLKIIRKISEKDVMKSQLYRRNEEELKKRKEQQEHNKQIKREERQRKSMQREDKDVNNLLSQEEQDQYFD